MAVTKISDKLLPLIDKAVEGLKDDWGEKKYGSRKDLVDDAVKRLLLDNGVVPTPEVSAS